MLHYYYFLALPCFWDKVLEIQKSVYSAPSDQHALKIPSSYPADHPLDITFILKIIFSFILWNLHKCTQCILIISTPTHPSSFPRIPKYIAFFSSCLYLFVCLDVLSPELLFRFPEDVCVTSFLQTSPFEHQLVTIVDSFISDKK